MTQEDLKQERIYVLLLAAIQFAHIVDFVVMMPLGPVLIKEFGISPAQFGGLVSSYNYAGAIAGIMFGLIADRFARRTLLGWVMAGFIIGTFLCGMATSFSLLLTARIFTGVFGGILNALVLAIVTDLVPFVRRGTAMGVVMSSFSVASVLGVPLGLTIADYMGWKWTFFFIASFSVLIWLAALKVLPHLVPEMKSGTAKQVLKRYLRIGTKADYLKAYSLIFLAAMTMFILIPFLAPYAVSNIGIETHQIKYMYFFGGAATVLTARLFGKLTDRLGSFKMYMILALISIAPVLLYTNAGPMSVVFYVLMGMFFMTIVSGRMIPCMTLISSVPAQEDRGTFMGLLNSVRSLGSATATLIGGLIIVETNQGMKNFDISGYLSITLVIITIIVARFIESSKNSAVIS
ncbi:MAG: MFS transporter [Deltaproteobacteria bacterium]|nr:MAG: MFS transporter [Deltaproteobacteria bacterium]